MTENRHRSTILHLIGSDFLGSPEKLILGQVGRLRDFDFVCASFVRPGRKSDFLEAARAAGYDAVPIEERSLYDSRIPGRIRALVAERQVNLIVSHGYKANFYGYRARRNLPLPQAAYFHGWTRENLRMRFYNFIDRRVLPRLDLVIAVSKASADLLAECGLDREKIRVVYNVLDLPEGYRLPERPSREGCTIGVIGRLSHEKGVHVLLEALGSIKGDLDAVGVEVYGDGLELENLKKQAVGLGLDRIVTFMGFRTDMDNVYPRFDFLAIPSLSEGHPLVVLEAWKHGLGIVAARAGGIPEVIEDGVTGRLVEVGSPQKLAEAIKWAISSPTEITAFGRAGLEELRGKYTYRAQAEQLRSIYRSIIETNGAKSC